MTNPSQKAANDPTPTQVPGSAERPKSDPLLGRERACQCAACGRYFTTTANFDRHRAWSDENGSTWRARSRPAQYDQRCCLNPADVGLVPRDNGHWGTPPMTPQERTERGWS